MEIESLEIRSAIAKIEYDITNMWKQIYPVGSIFITVSTATPSDWFGGTWERVGKGQYLLGVDPSDETGKFDMSDRTGGSFEHTLTIDEMPSHTHSILTPKFYAGESGTGTIYGSTDLTTQLTRSTSSRGGGQPFNITPPFYTVYIWKRTG